MCNNPWKNCLGHLNIFIGLFIFPSGNFPDLAGSSSFTWCHLRGQKWHFSLRRCIINWFHVITDLKLVHLYVSLQCWTYLLKMTWPESFIWRHFHLNSGYELVQLDPKMAVQHFQLNMAGLQSWYSCSKHNIIMKI